MDKENYKGGFALKRYPYELRDNKNQKPRNLKPESELQNPETSTTQENHQNYASLKTIMKQKMQNRYLGVLGP